MYNKEQINQRTSFIKRRKEILVEYWQYILQTATNDVTHKFLKLVIHVQAIKSFLKWNPTLENEAIKRKEKNT